MIKDVLVLICLESKNPLTEKEFFKSLTDNLMNVHTIYLDPEKSDSKNVSNSNVLKLKDKASKIKEQEKLCNVKIIFFSDGDNLEKQKNSLNNTLSLVKAFLNNYFSDKKYTLDFGSLLYDEGYAFEFFLWHISERFNQNLMKDNNKKLITKKVKEDMIEIYKKYNKNINNINDFKKRDKVYVIWKYIVETYGPPINHIEIIEKILELFDKNKRFSVYFEILEEIIKQYKSICNEK